MPKPPSKYDVLYKKYSFLSNVYMFECGNGWFQLLSDLCAKLDALQLGPQFKVSQVKEKFATLRFYVDDVPKDRQSEVNKLISEAATKSAHTCEHCGKPGRQTSLGRGCYLITLCGECEKQANA